MRHVFVGLCVLVGLSLATSAFAQSARASGSVRGVDGKPVKGATIRAVNKDSYPPQIASSTDDKGRWAMIGLRTGVWTFIAEAPGFIAAQTPWQVRVGGTAPIGFVLARDPGPVPFALNKNIQQQIVAANTLRDRGQYDQAIAAYEQLREQNPTLTSMTLVMAGTYRQKAAQETDPTTRRALLDRAIASYGTLLTAEPDNERAKAELASTRTEAATSR